MNTEMNSLQIQKAIEDWAQGANFSAPYGVLTGSHVSSKGTKSLTVVFGRARTLDCTVQIYNRNFITVRTNRHGLQSFKGYEPCMEFLRAL